MKSILIQVLVILTTTILFPSCGNDGGWQQLRTDSSPEISFKFIPSNLDKNIILEKIKDGSNSLSYLDTTGNIIEATDEENSYSTKSDSIATIENYSNYISYDSSLNAKKNTILLKTNELLHITDSGKLKLTSDISNSWQEVKLPSADQIKVKQLFNYNKNNLNFYIINCQTSGFRDQCYYSFDLSKWYELHVPNGNTYHVIADSNNLKLLMTPRKNLDTTEVFTLKPFKPASIAAYKKTDYSDKIELQLKLNVPTKDLSGISLSLWGADKYHYDKDEWNNLKWNHSFSNNTWKIEFSRKDIPVSNGDRFFIQALFNDNGFQNRYYIGPLQYLTYDWFKENKIYVLIIAGIVSYVILLSLLLLFKPFWIYLIYSKIKILDPFRELLGKYGRLVGVVSNITFFPFFVQHKRVLDAWVNKKQMAIINAFDNNPLSLNADDYVPLPLMVDNISNGKLIDIPTPEVIGGCFEQHRTLIEIIGVGGSGKSTLAFQIGRWASQKVNIKYFDKHVWIPIIIDQELNDLIKFTQDYLTLCLGEKVDDRFILALLSKQRLMIIVDALSERSKEMQDYFKTIHASIPLNALIITSRIQLSLKVRDQINLYPLPLSSDKLLFYLSSQINSRDVPLFKTLNNQIRLAEKISLLFTFKNQEIPIIPILLRLVIEKAFDIRNLTNFDQVLEKLPNSIPDVYFDYLNNVNPKIDVPNAMTNSSMRISAELIAKLSLDDDFVPKDIVENVIINNLKNAPLLNESISPLQRLIDNGILIVRPYAGADFIRFVYDPLAEYLAAMWWANDCGKVKSKWKALYDRVNELRESASAFKQALNLVHYTYWEKFQWCKPEELGE